MINKELPKLSDVEKSIDNLSYGIKDICIDYYNKGIEQGKSQAIAECIKEIDKAVKDIEDRLIFGKLNAASELLILKAKLQAQMEKQ